MKKFYFVLSLRELRALVAHIEKQRPYALASHCVVLDIEPLDTPQTIIGDRQQIDQFSVVVRCSGNRDNLQTIAYAPHQTT